MGLGDKLRAWAAADTTSGHRADEAANPFLAARRTWNDQAAANTASRQMWQLVGLLSLLIALASVGGVIYIGSQSKFVPYLVEVDKLGELRSAGVVQPVAKADTRVLKARVSTFISDLRTVTPDVALQRRAVFRAYAMLATRDPATPKTNEWLNGIEANNPFKRAATEMVSAEISAVLAQTPETFQVDWVETTRDRSGAVKGEPAKMRALVTVYVAPATSDTTEEQERNNPLGVYVRDFSWTKLAGSTTP